MIRTVFQKILLSLFIVFTFLNGQQQKEIVVKYKDSETQLLRWVRVIPYDDNVIRVVASADSLLSARRSLVVVSQPQEEPSYSIKEKNGLLSLETSKLLVQVSKSSGAVSFFSKDGKVLLKEESNGGRTITPTNVLGEQAYAIHQAFEAKPGEAFYGLGQHQNGIMNYRGHDVDLWQYNLVVAIPFLVSSNMYGILWDNYSRTKFGDPREYQSLDQCVLYDKNGQRGGLTAEYFTDEKFENLYTTRTETRIEHAYTDVNDPFPDGFNESVKTVRWSGSIECQKSGAHKFRLYCSSYTKMWLNGKLVVDSWRQNWLPWTHFPELTMEKGKRYDIKIEWIHNGGFISLQYLPPDDFVNPNVINLTSEVADQIDYYFIAGDNFDSIINSYRWLTGVVPMMPKWAMGLWQCRERYRTQDELLDVVREFRRRNIPLDNIVQDWFYWKEDRWGDHEFDSTRYPEPAGMVKTLHDSLHTRMMISVWPKFYVGTKHYDEFYSKGWLYMRNVEKGQRDWVGPGYISTFYDPYSEGARELFWEQINKKLYSLGIDAWWLDCTEPDIQSNLSRQETILRQHPTALGSGARYLNTYSLMNCQAVYEGQRKTNPQQRVFILTRSAFAGQQRYSAATWSGDVAARWHDLTMQIPAGLNFSISGIPYWTTDIGGFAVEPRFEKPDSANLEEWREQMTRWFQFGTFCPIFRVHGQYPYREMFYVAPPEHPAYQAMLHYDQLRYRLMPYIYTLTGMVTHRGYTIMRPLVMDFGDDEKVLEIGDQFMFGNSILVNPVTSFKSRSREVYLPKDCGWYDFHSGRYYKGGEKILANAPYTEIPLFVKEGSILPTGSAIQYSFEKPADTLRVFVFTGRDASFELYEDDGVTFDYEKGAYSWIPFSYSEKDKSLTIGKRQGTFPEMLTTRTIEVVWIAKKHPRSVEWNSSADVALRYDGNEIKVRMK
jgi:alpha-D-xyloside xylohydrolase